jgi:hypothetical protein
LHFYRGGDAPLVPKRSAPKTKTGAACSSAGGTGQFGDVPLPRPGTQRWAGREGTRSHTESWAEGRRHRPQHIAAAWAPAVVADRAGRVGAQPVAAQVTQRIDALNRETRQILHRHFPPAVERGGWRSHTSPENRDQGKTGCAHCAARHLWCQQ